MKSILKFTLVCVSIAFSPNNQGQLLNSKVGRDAIAITATHKTVAIMPVQTELRLDGRGGKLVAPRQKDSLRMVEGTKLEASLIDFFNNNTYPVIVQDYSLTKTELQKSGVDLNHPDKATILQASEILGVDAVVLVNYKIWKVDSDRKHSKGIDLHTPNFRLCYLTLFDKATGREIWKIESQYISTTYDDFFDGLTNFLVQKSFPYAVLNQPVSPNIPGEVSSSDSINSDQNKISSGLMWGANVMGLKGYSDWTYRGPNVANLGATFKFTRGKLLLETDIFLLETGVRFNESNQPSSQIFQSGNDRQVNTNLLLPILAGYHPFTADGKGVFFKGGVFISYLLKANYKIPSGLAGPAEINNKYQFKSLDAGITFAAGVDFPDTGVDFPDTITIDFRGNWGMIDINKNPNFAWSYVYTSKPIHTVLYQIGFGFWFGR